MRSIVAESGRTPHATTVGVDAFAVADAAAVDVAAVVITRDRRDEVLTSIDRLHRLPERPAVIVVDNGSVDGTAAAIRRAHPGAVLIEAGRNLGAAGRTLGVRHSTAPYVAFADDDSTWAPGALAAAVDLLDRHPRLGLVQAALHVDGEPDALCAEMAAGLPPVPDVPGVPIIGFLACAAVVRRTAYLDVGGFHPRFGVGGEEALLAIDLLAAGWQVQYVDQLVAHHRPSTRRAPVERMATERRNALWTQWLRRPPRPALTLTMQETRAAIGGDRTAARSLLEAARGLPWVLAERRRVPAEIESALRICAQRAAAR